LALEGRGNPEATAVIVDEEKLRAALLQEVRQRLGLRADDDGPEALEKVGEVLDEESEHLLEPPDTKAALRRLAERGDLPSDLYEIRIIDNIVDFHRENFELERDLIESTIRHPSREQHYGRAQSAREPSLVSLFYRDFSTPFPFKNFGMLVAAAREGLVLNVHQAWRIYSSVVNTRGATELVDLLRRFADAYGTDVNVDGKTGHFFLTADKPVPRNVHVDMGRKKGAVTISQFVQPGPSTAQPRACLILAIDLGRYEATLEKMAVTRAQIRELAPRSADTSRTIALAAWGEVPGIDTFGEVQEERSH
jgi:hypothetical protein